MSWGFVLCFVIFQCRVCRECLSGGGMGFEVLCLDFPLLCCIMDENVCEWVKRGNDDLCVKSYHMIREMVIGLKCLLVVCKCMFE